MTDEQPVPNTVVTRRDGRHDVLGVAFGLEVLARFDRHVHSGGFEHELGGLEGAAERARDDALGFPALLGECDAQLSDRTDSIRRERTTRVAVAMLTLGESVTEQ